MRLRLNLLAAALLTAFGLYLLNSSTREEVGELSGSELALNQDYDYFMTEVDSTRFRRDGSPAYRIRARRYTHYPEPDHGRMEAPAFVLYGNTPEPWRITAEQGRVQMDTVRDEQRVVLRDNVVIRGTGPAGREVNIYTEFLSIYPESRYVSTDAEVRLVSAGGRLSGTGMTADLNTNQVQLKANVRGIYE